jgi:hypothetical protein
LQRPNSRVDKKKTIRTTEIISTGNDNVLDKDGKNKNRSGVVSETNQIYDGLQMGT